MHEFPNDGDPEKLIRGVLDACSDCDVCRFLMDESCLLFPELYRLYDKEREDGAPVSETELRRLAELCTLCGLCPCPNIRADVIRSKIERVHKEGMPLGIRLLADAQRFGRWCGMVPAAVNAALSLAPIDRTIKKIVGIHPHRRLPRIARESFFSWARKKGLDRPSDQNPKAAYFAGCTAGYLFPEVARSAVAVMAHNGISVHVTEQQCCGMPTLLEGDLTTTLERVRSNIDILSKTVRAGYDLVCSCPTCGFFMKVLLKERAFYSPEYQRSVNAATDEIKIQDRKAGTSGFVSMKKSMFKDILKDDGFFSGLDPLARIDLSDAVLDMGEYLDRLYQEKRLNTHFGAVAGRMAYFAPCHQREQDIGTPYEKLLRLLPGLTIVRVGGSMDCCGMGGSLGFKENFHAASIRLGQALMQKIEAVSPEAIITDCLSCRLQFQHMLPYPVLHPLEIIARAYGSAGVGKRE